MELEDSELFKKANKIEEISSEIVNLVNNYSEEEVANLEILKNHAMFIAEDSLKIPIKISGAWHVDLYDIKMENAAIIRKSARELRTFLMGLEIHGFKETEYLDLLRNEIEEFRVLFAEWVKTFDPWDYIIDRWGLFNPPGVNYDDKDPDDDLPFNPDGF